VEEKKEVIKWNILCGASKGGESAFDSSFFNSTLQKNDELMEGCRFNDIPYSTLGRWKYPGKSVMKDEHREQPIHPSTGSTTA
jgi:hypothetical protein